MTLNNITTIDPQVLLSELRRDFTVVLPEKIESTEEMWSAQKLLSKLGAQYAFLMAATVEVKEKKRRMKREKADKTEVDVMMEREDLLSTYSEMAKANYNAVSRMVSIRQAVYDELRLLHRSGQ